MVLRRKSLKQAVKLVSIAIKSENGVDKFSFPLKKTNGGLSDYAKGLAVILPNLDFSRPLSISPSRKKNDKGYLSRFLFFNYADGAEPKHPEFAHRYGKDGDIPMGEQVEKMGNKVWNFDKQDTYLYNILEAQLERFKEFRQENKIEVESTPKPHTKATSVPQAAVSEEAASQEEESDDLPF